MTDNSLKENRMRYHIDTIPVWDAVKLGSECPFCVLRRREEQGQVERFLGGSGACADDAYSFKRD